MNELIGVFLGGTLFGVGLALVAYHYLSEIEFAIDREDKKRESSDETWIEITVDKDSKENPPDET